MFTDIIVLVPSTSFQTYNITSCDHGHIPLHHPRKSKENQKKRNIKSRKIDKKRKMLVSKHTMTRASFKKNKSFHSYILVFLFYFFSPFFLFPFISLFISFVLSK